MKIISLDLETTGLEPMAHQILEIGIVFDELVDDDASEKVGVETDSLESMRIVVLPDSEYMTGNIIALGMNSDLLKEIAAHKKDGTKRENTVYCGRDQVVDRIADRMKDLGYDPMNIVVAGKNPNFDIGFMKVLPEYGKKIKFNRRVLDPSFFFVHGSDTEIPNLAECLRRIGQKPRDLHTAVGDARDVIDLVRYSFDNKVLPIIISPEQLKIIRESAGQLREMTQVEKEESTVATGKSSWSHLEKEPLDFGGQKRQ